MQPAFVKSSTSRNPYFVLANEQLLDAGIITYQKEINWLQEKCKACSVLISDLAATQIAIPKNVVIYF